MRSSRSFFNQVKRGASLIAACSVLWLTAGCDPPGRPGAEVSEAESRADTTDFKTLFAQNCQGCHGEAGKNGPARILNNAVYLAVLTKDTLRQILVNGRAAYGMPAWARSQGGPLSDKQIDALVDGIYSDWGEDTSGKPRTLAGAPGYASTTAADPGHGKKLFGRNCFGCHAKGGLIGPVTEPSYLQLVSDQMLRTSIIVGRPDLGMPDYRILNSGRPLADQDVTDLTAYLVSLRPPGGNVQRPADSGAGHGGDMNKGQEGSGNGPGSPRQETNEGNKGKGSSSQQGAK